MRLISNKLGFLATAAVMIWVSSFSLLWADCEELPEKVSFAVAMAEDQSKQRFQINKTEISAKSFWFVAQRENWPVSDFVAEFISDGELQRPCRPASQVNWEWSQRYCESQGGRLPYAIEWMDAARAHIESLEVSHLAEEVDQEDQDLSQQGSEEFTDFEGDDLASLIDDLLQTEIPQEQFGDSETELQDVGQALVSANGLLGIRGNVWEWVQDDYNPENSEKAPYKQLKGGSYLNADLLDDKGLKRTWEPEFIGFANPDRGYRQVGFRCVWTTSEFGNQ